MIKINEDIYSERRKLFSKFIKEISQKYLNKGFQISSGITHVAVLIDVDGFLRFRVLIRDEYISYPVLKLSLESVEFATTPLDIRDSMKKFLLRFIKKYKYLGLKVTQWRALEIETEDKDLMYKIIDLFIREVKRFELEISGKTFTGRKRL